jgi:DNA polymerase-1
MEKILFDIETDGLWPEVSKIWLLCLIDIETKRELQFSDYDPDLPPLSEGIKILDKAKLLAGHNIIGYDLMVMKYLLGWEPPKGVILRDTWIMSQLLRFKRQHKHSLEGWGSHLRLPKLDHNDWSCYSKEMLTYCRRDIHLNLRVYATLKEEALKTIKINPLFKIGLEVEMRFAYIEAKIRARGWDFNIGKAEDLMLEMNQRMFKIEDEIEPMIGMVCIAKDSKDEFKEPTWRKDGYYNAVMCKWFSIDPATGQSEDRLVDGAYCRVEFEQGKLSSDKVLKHWLYSLGWEPDEWNVERINGKFVNKSPKLTESSLEKLGDIGKKISEYNTLKNRRGILNGWIEEAKRDGRLHGRMWTIGTPTFRCRHEIIANLPSVGTMYGEEMRSLLMAPPGYEIVGADSAGNQMRGLCHYIGNDDFTNEVINGDVHQRNADALSVSRKVAKPFLYAFLFGGGAGKLGLILSGVRDAKLGQQAIDKFQNSIPGLKELRDNLALQYNRTKEMFGEENAFIRGIDGRIVFVGSPHQVLNYLLQTLEGVTCKAAAMYLEDKLTEENIPFEWLIHYHDELAVGVPSEYTERVKQLAVEAFTEAPKWFGVTCMNGDAKSGYTYAEVH